jgi:hypothetical protein
VAELRILPPIFGLALLHPIARLGAQRLQATGTNGGHNWAYTMSSARVDAISLLGAFGQYGVPGSLSFLFRPISLIWLVVLVVYTYLWAQPAVRVPTETDSHELDLLGPVGNLYVAARDFAAPEIGLMFRCYASNLSDRNSRPSWLEWTCVANSALGRGLSLDNPKILS